MNHILTGFDRMLMNKWTTVVLGRETVITVM